MAIIFLIRRGTFRLKLFKKWSSFSKSVDDAQVLFLNENPLVKKEDLNSHEKGGREAQFVVETFAVGL